MKDSWKHTIKRAVGIGSMFMIVGVAGLGAYRYFAHKTGYCIETNTFNDRDTIKRLAIEKMITTMYEKIDNRTIKLSITSYDEFLNKYSPCCYLNPSLGDYGIFRPNLGEYFFGWSYGLETPRTGDYDVTVEIDAIKYAPIWGDIHYKRKVGSFIISNCGGFAYRDLFKAIMP